MADKEYIFEKIERYLQGKMSPEERTDFEQELRKDSELQKKYELHVAANELLLERRLQKVRAKTKAHSDTKISSGKTLIYATTTLVGLALLLTIFFYTTSNTSENGEVLRTDSIVINTSKQKDDLRKIITQKDSSAYDTLVTSVQNRDKSPTSRVDVIYDNIQEQDKDSLNEQKLDKNKSKADTNVLNKIKKQESVSAETNENVQKQLKDQKPMSCEDYVIHFDVKTKNTCIGKEIGSASVQVENDKTAPYQFYITNEFDENVNSNGLAKGSYSIYLIDKNGCKSNSLGFYIEEEFCLEDYMINTSYQETLRLPKSQNKYLFRVYDKTGQLYYTRKVEEQENLDWDGSNSNGQIIPGYYLIQVELEEGDLKKGSITIKN